jgi:hypothetical protein
MAARLILDCVGEAGSVSTTNLRWNCLMNLRIGDCGTISRHYHKWGNLKARNEERGGGGC